MPRTRRQSQSGLSLIETMIALVVGLILIAGVLSIYISSRQGYGTNSAVGQVQENGRFAMGFISNATRQAGYMGCGISRQVTSYLNPISGDLPYDFTSGIAGFEYSGTAPGSSYTEHTQAPTASSWTPVLDSSLPVSPVADYAEPGSDVLAVRYVADDPTYITSIPSSDSASYKVNNNDTLAPSDVVLVTNCLSSIVMQITNVSPGGGSGNLVANTGGKFTPGNGRKGIPQTFLGGQIVRPITTVFYIGQGLDRQPALYQAVSDPGQTSGFAYNELVPGVENMQVLYGLDTTGTRTPSQYVTADNVTNWNQVVSVRVALLVRSNLGAVTLAPAAITYNLLGTVVTAPRDTRLRRVFTADIYIRNEQPQAGA